MKKIRSIDGKNKLKSLPLDFSISPDAYTLDAWKFSEMQEMNYKGQDVFRLEARCILNGHENLVLEWFATEKDLEYINGTPDDWRTYAMLSFGESLNEKMNHYINRIGKGLSEAIKTQNFFMNTDLRYGKNKR